MVGTRCTHTVILLGQLDDAVQDIQQPIPVGEAGGNAWVSQQSQPFSSCPRWVMMWSYRDWASRCVSKRWVGDD